VENDEVLKLVEIDNLGRLGRGLLVGACAVPILPEMLIAFAFFWAAYALAIVYGLTAHRKSGSYALLSYVAIKASIYLLFIYLFILFFPFCVFIWLLSTLSLFGVCLLTGPFVGVVGGLGRVLGFLHLPFVWVLWFPLVLLAFLGVVLFQSLRSRYAFSCSTGRASHSLLAHHPPPSTLSIPSATPTERTWPPTHAGSSGGWPARRAAAVCFPLTSLRPKTTEKEEDTSRRALSLSSSR
jgi:hypothetical protein